MKGCRCDYCKKIIPEGDIACSKESEIGIYCSIACLSLAYKPRIEAYRLTEELAEIKSNGLKDFDHPLNQTTQDVLDVIQNLAID